MGNIIRQKFAYSSIGKAVAKFLRFTIYKNDRIHWVQDRPAGAKNWWTICLTQSPIL